MKNELIKIAGLIILLTSCQDRLGTKPDAIANWDLSLNESNIYLITTKNSSIAEISAFENFSANIDSSGFFKLTLDMNSLETNIPIRNERIQKLLFETEIFPTAEIYTQLSSEQLKPGLHKVEFDADVHGVSNKFHADIRVFKENNKLIATLERPIVMQAGYFGFTHGIEQLRKVAGLKSIDVTVPVNFTLTFIQN